MKKYLLLLASAALLLVGCAKENFTEQQEGKLVTATFTASLDNSVATRAVADGDGAAASVNRCIMEIYYGGEFYARQIKKVTDKKTTFTAQMVSNRKYTVAFWADKVDNAETETGLAADKYYTTTSLKEISLKGAYSGNDDARDAFFHVGEYTVAQAGSSFGAGEEDKILLKRPFAQMNVITTDWDKAASVTGLAPEKVKVTLKNALVNFNAVTGKASGSQILTYEAAVYIAPNPQQLVSTTEKTLSMDYLFASDSKAVIDIDWKALHGKDAAVEHAFAAVPYQRNYRTNIKGALLTTQGQWTVTVEPTWDGEITHPVVIATTLEEAQAAVGPSEAGAQAAGTVIVKQEAVTNRNQSNDKTKTQIGGTTTSITASLPEGAKAIEFILTPQSNKDVTFELPKLPEDQGETKFYWYIRHEEGYPTENLNVKVATDDATRVIIDAPNNTHVVLNDVEYTHVIAITGTTTLVVPQGIKVDKLTVNKGGVEIHGEVGELEITGTKEEVFFRSCEGLSAAVFAKIYKESEGIDFIDRMYTYELVGEKYNIYKLPVVAMIGEVEYPSIAAALAAVKENETIEILSDIALDSPITISNSDITIDGNNHTIAVSDAEYWNQYKIGGAAAGLGAVNMISVTGSKFTLKDITLDGKDCRGVSLCTTSGGKDVLYQNVTYTGRGSGHYYGEAAGLVTFDGCKFDTHGYAVHFGGESSVDDDVVIKDCELNGWSSFGACKSVTISDSHFGGANDEGKNGWLAVLRPYCPTTITNCTFSDIFLHEAVTGYDYIGLGTGAATTVVLKGCKIVNDSKEETDAAIYSIVRDNGFGNEAAQQGSVFAFDATGNATDGYTAGTFYAKNPANIKVAPSYEVKAVEGKENIYTVAVKPVAKVGDTEYATLQEAFDAARAAMGGTITLIADVVLAKTITWNGADDSKRQHGDGTVTDCSNKYTFDLNGYHVTSQEGKNCKIEVRGCEFNIKDSKGSGNISNPNGFAFYLGSEREPHYDNCGVLNISGGTFKGKNDNPCSAFGHVYSIGTDGTTNDNHVNAKIINIYGGEFEGLSCDEVKVNIYGGHFTSYIYKGKRNDTAEYLDGKENDAIFVYGGKFDITGWKTQTLEPYKFDMVEITNDLLHIYAGEFNLDPTAYVMEGSKVEKVGDRWIVTQNN